MWPSTNICLLSVKCLSSLWGCYSLNQWSLPMSSFFPWSYCVKQRLLFCIYSPSQEKLRSFYFVLCCDGLTPGLCTQGRKLYNNPARTLWGSIWVHCSQFWNTSRWSLTLLLGYQSPLSVFPYTRKPDSMRLRQNKNCGQVWFTFNYYQLGISLPCPDFYYSLAPSYSSQGSSQVSVAWK